MKNDKAKKTGLIAGASVLMAAIINELLLPLFVSPTFLWLIKLVVVMISVYLAYIFAKQLDH
ncbi:hypothetical protein DLJ48_05295 [Oenococcus sicerae]|uniref:Uncharacterized protein n=1 Tax=Oenococcus sicerae TaxID=2203724 RepID=A0ABX5QMH2_9LACO|nr:hypothetical protein [Oenococcus sicerae]QAS69981.1 hypothetical protein DLJ48_05295 [Oenococcus sicerae]